MHRGHGDQGRVPEPRRKKNGLLVRVKLRRERRTRRIVATRITDVLFKLSVNPESDDVDDAHRMMHHVKHDITYISTVRVYRLLHIYTLVQLQAKVKYRYSRQYIIYIILYSII